MTLHELLSKKMTYGFSDSCINFNDNVEFYKSIGKIHMCEELINLLSDETLSMEVITRAESITRKGETK